MAAASTQLAALAWRQYTFFEVAPIRDTHDVANTPDIFRLPGEISTTSSSSAGILVADIHGSIHILNRTFESVRSWQAHLNGRVTHMVEQKGILVTLGEEESARLPLLKVWDLDHKDKKTGAPVLLRSVKVQHGNKPHPVSTLALSSSLSHLAIGLGDGTVLLYRNLDQSLFSGSTSLTALPKPKTIHESPNEPITGLGFRNPLPSSTEKSERENLVLFIVTISRVWSYLAVGKGSGAAPKVVDEVGCGLGCAVMDNRSRDIVVARDEAIYMCNPEGRGDLYAIEWPKISVTAFRNYLVIVSPPFLPSATSTSATVRNYVSRAPNPTAASQADVSKVTIFDPENKFVVYSGATFTDGVRDILIDNERLYVLGNDGKLFQLIEKSTSQKLEILTSRTLYRESLGLARSEGVDESAIAGLYKQYGDHLYIKGEYDTAIQQYVNTLGHLQPSYVIRKFLDAQRIQNLATYLQELHARGFANSDHTTLLLNTYAKLKDVARLDAFIKREASSQASKSQSLAASKDELPFDLETAIRVCRQAGYLEHAAYLAKKYERHDEYLRIQIEDAGDIKDALVYLRSLGSEATASNLVKYGRVLLSKLPEETTQLFVDVCTGLTSLPPQSSSTAEVPVKATTSAGLPYLPNFIYNRGSDPSAAEPPTPPAIQPRSAAHVRSPTMASGIGESPEAEASPSFPQTSSPSTEPLPPAQQYFAHFVDHPQEFISFLEAIAYSRWQQRADASDPNSISSIPILPPPPISASPIEDRAEQTAIWNTLLELYLTLAQEAALDAESPSEPKSSAVATLRRKALFVLNHPETLPYDPTHALIVCSTQSFTEGLVLLWEHMGMYEDVLRYWMDREAHDEGDSAIEASSKVVHYLNLYGPAHPHLYPLVLRFLTSSPALLSRHSEDVVKLLETIDGEKIMPPLGVIQVLSRNGVASVGLVKAWLMKRIAESRDEIDSNRQLIESYRTETKGKLQEVSDLSDPDRPRVFHVAKCSACRSQIDLPAVHFLCGHSYHERCLPDHETECPNCAREHGVIKEIRRDNEAFAKQHDLFMYNVEHEGFAAIASAFSKGLVGRGVADTTA